MSLHVPWHFGGYGKHAGQLIHLFGYTCQWNNHFIVTFGTCIMGKKCMKRANWIDRLEWWGACLCGQAEKFVFIKITLKLKLKLVTEHSSYEANGMNFIELILLNPIIALKCPRIVLVHAQSKRTVWSVFFFYQCKALQIQFWVINCAACLQNYVKWRYYFNSLNLNSLACEDPTHTLVYSNCR